VTFVSVLTAHIIGVLSIQIRSEIVERLPQFLRMLLIHTEYYRLSETIRLAHEICQVLGDRLIASPQSDDSLEVLRPVLLIRNLPSVPIELALVGSPADCISSRENPVDLVGSEESILDPLAE